MEFVIVGPLDVLDGEQLYWSNKNGWVDKGSATVFSDEAIVDPMESTGREFLS